MHQQTLQAQSEPQNPPLPRQACQQKTQNPHHPPHPQVEASSEQVQTCCLQEPLQKTRSQDPQTAEKEENHPPQTLAQKGQTLLEEKLQKKIQTQHSPLPQKNQKTQTR
jgi:hypothetical protein